MKGSSNQQKVSTLDQAEPEPTQFKEEPDELCINQAEESLLLNQDADVHVELKSEYEENFGNCKKMMFQFKELSHYHQRIRNAETELHKTGKSSVIDMSLFSFFRDKENIWARLCLSNC